MPVEIVPFREFEGFDAKDGSFFNCCEIVPLAHQIITNPTAHHRFPCIPTGDGDDAFYATIRYWDSCYYYLRVILGWSDPAAGMFWYFENKNSDVEDYRIEILKCLWDYEGQLELLAAWLFSNSHPYIREMQLSPHFGFDIPPCHPLELDIWWREFRQKYRNGKSPYPADPYHGGNNPLHLGHFEFVYESPESEAVLLVSDKKDRTATLIIENAYGWVSALVNQCGKLPELGGRSWHVHVFAKTIGYLGMFRKSRQSGMWFHGKHSLHSVGKKVTRDRQIVLDMR